LFSVGGADYFSLKSNCIFSPPRSAIKNQRHRNKEDLTIFHIIFIKPQQKRVSQLPRPQHKKWKSLVAGKKQYFPGKKTTNMIFFEASMMCLL